MINLFFAYASRIDIAEGVPSALFTFFPELGRGEQLPVGRVVAGEVAGGRMVVKVAELKVRVPGLKRTPNLVEGVDGGSASSESEAALPGQSWISDGQ